MARYFAGFRKLATLPSRLCRPLLLLLARFAFRLSLLLLLPLLLPLPVLPLLLLLLRVVRLPELLLLFLLLQLLSRTRFLKKTKTKDSRNKPLAWQRAPHTQCARPCCWVRVHYSLAGSHFLRFAPFPP